MAEKIMGSYLYELKPYIDKEKWASAAGYIEHTVDKKRMTYDQYKAKKGEVRADQKRMQKLQDEINKLREEQKTATGQRLDDITRILGKKTYTDEHGVVHEGTGLERELEKVYEKVMRGKAEIAENSPGKMQMLAGKMGGFVGWISKASAAIGIFYAAMKKAITGAMELVDSQKELANKLNAMGSFGSMGTRDLMARYGVSSNRAVAMSTTLNMMGLSESDIGRMTKAQRKTYNELIQYYEDGINRIDTNKLKDYYKTMEEYQIKQAKWKMDLQTTILKMVAESDGFKKLVGSLEKFFDSTIKFLNSPIIKWLFDTMAYFLSEVTDIASGVLGIFGSSPSSSGSTVTNNSTNNYYIYGSENSNSEDIARKVALKQSGAAY